MPHKVDAAQRCADLLVALARSANVRLALSECGISAYWAYRRRRADADFDARWKTAVRNGRRALAKAQAARARNPKAARPSVGKTLVGSSGKGTLQLQLEKPCTFTGEKQEVFLAGLRATCNVRGAAKLAGVSAHGAYTRYHADAALREKWNAALVEGRVHLEMALMGAGRTVFEGTDEELARACPPVETPAITGMDARAAMQLLRLHTPGARRRGQWVKPADAETTRREILAKVAAIRASRGMDEQ